MSWVRTLAVELGPRNIRANAIAPGGVLTPRVAEMLGEEGRKAQEPNVPLRRMAVPSDIAAAILYLSSDLSSFVSGHTLIVDGGVIAKFGYPVP
jgi:3-oxoacyl-[acyl-carrier protein] reductase